MSEQKPGDRCACADFLNFGEPQPDCHRCDGTGTVKDPEGTTGPVFGPAEPVDVDREQNAAAARVDFLNTVDRGVAKLRKHAEALVADLTPKERAILEKRGLLK